MIYLTMISITAHHWIWPGRESAKLSRGRVKNVDPSRYGDADQTVT